MSNPAAGEIESLLRQIHELKERLSRARRDAPREPTRDYELRRADGSPVRLSELFARAPAQPAQRAQGVPGAPCFLPLALWAGRRGVVSSVGRRQAAR